MDNSRGRDLIHEYRCTWLLSVGFKSTIPFVDYDALCVDVSPGSRYKVCTVQGRQKLTLYHGSPTWLPLPEVALRATGVHGLPIKMPRVIHFFGGACAGLHDFTGVGGVGRRLDSCLRLEMLHATMCALHHEYISAGCVWLVSDECLEILESFEFIPPLRYERGDQVSEIRREDPVNILKEARNLDASYLFSRREFPSQVSESWAFFVNGSFVRSSSYTGPRLGGLPVTGLPQGNLGYTRGFVPRFVSFDSRMSDAELRESNVAGPILQGFAARSEGWSVLETIEIVFQRARAAELRESGLREELGRIS